MLKTQPDEIARQTERRGDRRKKLLQNGGSHINKEVERGGRENHEMEGMAGGSFESRVMEKSTLVSGLVEQMRILMAYVMRCRVV